MIMEKGMQRKRRARLLKEETIYAGGGRRNALCVKILAKMKV